MPETKSLFNKVAEHYDLLNTIFSLGMDKSWRRYLAEEIDGSNVLDIATGTAEVAIEILNRSDKRYITGIDPSRKMLDQAGAKLKTVRVKNKIFLAQGVAEWLPFKNESFDAITIAFGIRNTVNPLESLKEMKRVLRPGGRVGILEFAVPQNKLFGPVYMFYLRNVLPFIGSFFEKRNEYEYLADSIPKFPQHNDFIALMEKAGFKVKKTIELTMATVIIYIGVKED
jgi:demethylmenaquinone methyltransferase/2-methoxy-6-polyprenyl-1,4-benzoquinol methylase